MRLGKRLHAVRLYDSTPPAVHVLSVPHVFITQPQQYGDTFKTFEHLVPIRYLIWFKQGAGPKWAQRDYASSSHVCPNRLLTLNAN